MCAAQDVSRRAEDNLPARLPKLVRGYIGGLSFLLLVSCSKYVRKSIYCMDCYKERARMSAHSLDIFSIKLTVDI